MSGVLGFLDLELMVYIMTGSVDSQAPRQNVNSRFECRKIGLIRGRVIEHLRVVVSQDCGASRVLHIF